MRVTAPGKVVLLGEYAVLDGAPAIVAAVDRGVACEVTASAVLQIATPGDDRFVRAALAEVDAPAARYTFSDWRPVHTTTKVGLGGSAAATVAAVVAGRRIHGLDTNPQTVCTIAHAVHRRVQGSGSGIDVAASAYGGVSHFQDGRVTPVAPVAPRLVFTGQSAQTGPRVTRYLAWTDRTAFVDASTAIVDRFATDPLGALASAGTLLRAMAEAAGIAYWNPAIDRIVALAAAQGGAAKPSGAGGGDVVVALFEDPEAADRFEASARAEGFLPIPVGLAGPAAVA